MRHIPTGQYQLYLLQIHHHNHLFHQVPRGTQTLPQWACSHSQPCCWPSFPWQCKSHVGKGSLSIRGDAHGSLNSMGKLSLTSMGRFSLTSVGRLCLTSARQSDLGAKIARKSIDTRGCGAAARCSGWSWGLTSLSENGERLCRKKVAGDVGDVGCRGVGGAVWKSDSSADGGSLCCFSRVFGERQKV